MQGWEKEEANQIKNWAIFPPESLIKKNYINIKWLLLTQ